MREVTVVVRTPGHESTRTLRAGGPPLTIGRDPACQLSIADKRVSWAHAWVWVGETGEVWVRDLGSMNGTGVDGVRVEGQSRVPLGGTVQIATALELQVQAQAEEAAGPTDAWFLDDLGSGLRQQVVGGTHTFSLPGVPTVTLTRKENGWWLLGGPIAIPVEPGIPFGAGGRTLVLNHVGSVPQGTVGFDTSVN